MMGVLFVQAAAPTTMLDMITGGTFPTRVVLVALGVFSLFSWWIIFWKARQFRVVQRQGDDFIDAMERAARTGATAEVTP